MGWQTRGKLRRNWSRLIHYAVAMGFHSPAGVVMQFFFAQRISCSGFLWQPLSWLFCEAPDPATMLMNRNLCATATCQLQIAEAKIFAEFLPNKSIRKYLASTTERTSEVCPRNLSLLLFKPLRVCRARSFGFHLIFAIGFYPFISYNLRSAAANNKISSREGKTYAARGSSMALAAFPASEASSSHPRQNRSHSNSHNSGGGEDKALDLCCTKAFLLWASVGLKGDDFESYGESFKV